MTTKKDTIELDKIFAEEDEANVAGLLKANASNEKIYENLEDIKQGSKAWFYARLGLFTGSKIPDLMKRGRAKEDMFGETAKDVIRKVHIERNLTEIGKELYVDELFKANFRQTEWGNKYESFAREKYSDALGKEVIETSFVTHPTMPFIGGSFDGKVPSINKIIEIKCPYDVLKHDDNVQIALDVEEKGFPKNHTYYGQIQCNIFVGEAESCDFISYDPRLNNNSLVVINVERDDEYIDEMLFRIQIAQLAETYMNDMDVDGALLIARKQIENVKAN